MATINAKELKTELKSRGVKVLRVLTYNNGVILTVGKDHALFCEEYLASINIVCIRPANLPTKAVANILHYANAAEFTSLHKI